MEKTVKKIPSPVQGKAVRVPVIMQMEALECGAACLDMILAYYKRYIPLERVRSDCGVSRDGSSAKNILKAARNYGFKARALIIDTKGLRKNGKFPCVVHWNYNHFVVVDGFKGDKVLLNDPARGTLKLSLEEFEKAYTGIYLEFEPTEDFQPGGKRRSVLTFAKERLKGTKTAIIFFVLTTIITSLLAIVKPAFQRIFLDRIITGNDAEWINPFMGALLLLMITEFVVGCIMSIYTYKIEGKLAIIANSKYMWHIIRLPMEFFSQRMAGDIADRQRKNETVAKELIQTLAPVVLNAVLTVIYLIVMFSYSVPLALISVTATIINLVVAKIISKKRINVTRVQMRDAGKLSGVTVTGIEMIETIKASGAENGFFGRWSGYQASVNTQNVKYAKINQYLGALPELVSDFANITVLGLGIYLVICGEFTVGMVTAFQSIMMLFSSPVKSLINAGQKIQEMRTNMERIEDVMNYETDVTDSDEREVLDESVSYSKLSGAIEMKNVSFGYSKLANPLISDFNLSVKPGSSIAFVGSSGCGKSTLAKLISGLYKPWKGEIEFDEKSIDKINRSVFTGSVAVVDQDIILFEDTIANNIKMWDSSIEDFEMIMAARDAHIHDDIMMRNGGYQYKIIEGGRDFSGGQRQRLEIARVLAQDPTIVILDEATSALDAKTEYEVVQSIRDRGITCIVIAHRLSTIRDCDEIIVMDNGNVVERGKHDELMQKGGLYTELITNE
ncbi:MAG: NHLP family bacteriocin export ABC transporter peptidase/permease/ATPase subunit [Ruminococcus sp.]|nr:NHLP family bacteriocin export ABC transporter peptidase/permease/ATPase subunit [Ruminococcus sp.]